MAYLDIPSDIQFLSSSVYPVLLPTLDVKDFGLATAGDVSNVVVVLNVYNTATANSWDYEACLINNDQVITANNASNVYHSNTTSSERVFIFNANTFSKHTVESQSFGFRYRPVSDGAVRIYVGNVRIRINNTQPANGITSYISYQTASDEVGVNVTKTSDINLLRGANTGISNTKQSFIAKILDSITSVSTSLISNVLSSVQELLLECAVGLQNTSHKSISLLKSLVLTSTTTSQKDISAVKGTDVGISEGLQKSINLIRSSITSLSTSVQKIISATKATETGIHTSVLKSSMLYFSNAVASITSLASEVILGLHELILACSVGVQESIHKYTHSSFNLIVGISDGVNKHMSIVKELIAEVKNNVQKSVDVIKDTKVAIESSVQKAVSIIQDTWLSTTTSITNAINSFTEWFQIPLQRISVIFKKDKLETLSKNTIEPVKKRDKF